MTCLMIQPQLSAYLDNELSPAEFAQVEDHLDFCGSCQRDLREVTTLKQRLHILEKPIVPPDLIASIEERTVSRPWRISIRPFWIWTPALAAAAGLLLWAVLHSRSTHRVIPNATLASQPPVPAPTPAPAKHPMTAWQRASQEDKEREALP